MSLLRKVPASGPLNAKVMIIGEAAGTTEEIKHEPFCGWSGQFLREMCERAGLAWSDLRVDNVVQYQPNKNNFSVFYSDKQQRQPTYELLAWWADLRQRILEVRPKVIIAAGDHPLFALTGNRFSTQWRGSVVPYESQDFHCWIVPIVHPSFARRCYNMTSSKRKETRQPWFYITVYDLIKAKRVSEGGWKPLERVEKIFPAYYETMEYLELLEALPQDSMITTDVETLRREHIKCVGVTHRKDYAMCIPFVKNSLGAPFYSLQQEAEVWKKLDRVFNTHRMCNQTIAFDHAMFWRDIGLNFTESIFLDTAILHALLYPELKHDLGFLASIYTDMPYFKYLGRMAEGKSNVQQTFTYNCYDCQSTHEVAEKLIKEAKQEGMWEYYLSKRLPLAKWAIRQHQYGLAIDVDRREEIINRVWTEDLKPVQTTLNECLMEVGYEGVTKVMTKTKQTKFEGLGLEFDPDQEGLNVNSPQQVVALLRALGYQVSDSSEETLSALAEESPVAKAIHELRSGYSLLTSVAKPTDTDGRFRTSINLHVTETTRLSSVKSHYGSGANLQNVTLKAKPLFTGSWDE